MQAEASQKTIDARCKDLSAASSALVGALDKASGLTDRELSWLKSRELTDLSTTASSASLEIAQKAHEFQSMLTASMQETGQLWHQATQAQQTAFNWLTAMQTLLRDTSSKPATMQLNVRRLTPPSIMKVPFLPDTSLPSVKLGKAPYLPLQQSFPLTFYRCA